MQTNMPQVNSFLMGGMNDNNWINLSGNTFLDIGENLPPNPKVYNLVYH
jgi:hypothetical protein